MCNKWAMKSDYKGEGYPNILKEVHKMEDKEIIRLYFDRAEDAIGKTAEKYGARCLYLAKNIVGNDSDAEECVNDMYFAVWNRIPPEIPYSFFAFIAKITRNIALNRLDYNRAERRNGEYTLVLEELSEILPDESSVIREEDSLMDAINAFLKSEKKKNRVIFVRRYFYHDSMSEIASRVDMQENAVRASLFRTRKKLAIYLRKQGLGGIYVKE